MSVARKIIVDIGELVVADSGTLVARVRQLQRWMERNNMQCVSLSVAVHLIVVLRRHQRILRSNAVEYMEFNLNALDTSFDRLIATYSARMQEARPENEASYGLILCS